MSLHQRLLEDEHNVDESRFNGSRTESEWSRYEPPSVSRRDSALDDITVSDGNTPIILHHILINNTNRQPLHKEQSQTRISVASSNNSNGSRSTSNRGRQWEDEHRTGEVRSVVSEEMNTTQDVFNYTSTPWTVRPTKNCHPWRTLPTAIQGLICTYLPVRSLALIAGVDHSWKKVSEDQKLWKHIYSSPFSYPAEFYRASGRHPKLEFALRYHYAVATEDRRMWVSERLKVQVRKMRCNWVCHWAGEVLLWPFSMFCLLTTLIPLLVQLQQGRPLHWMTFIPLWILIAYHIATTTFTCLLWNRHCGSCTMVDNFLETSRSCMIGILTRGFRTGCRTNGSAWLTFVLILGSIVFVTLHMSHLVHISSYWILFSPLLFAFFLCCFMPCFGWRLKGPDMWAVRCVQCLVSWTVLLLPLLTFFLLTILKLSNVHGKHFALTTWHQVFTPLYFIDLLVFAWFCIITYTIPQHRKVALPVWFIFFSCLIPFKILLGYYLDGYQSKYITPVVVASPCFFALGLLTLGSLSHGWWRQKWPRWEAFPRFHAELERNPIII